MNCKNRLINRSFVALLGFIVLVSIVTSSCTFNINIKNPNTRINNTIMNNSVENVEENTSLIECNSNEDCVHAPVCCHRGAAMCIPKYKVNEDSLNQCHSVMCTMECRECTTCSCVNHKCVTKQNKGTCC